MDGASHLRVATKYPNITRRFYERCGFVPVAELPDFYGTDDAKVIYGKRLNLAPIR